MNATASQMPIFIDSQAVKTPNSASFFMLPLPLFDPLLLVTDCIATSTHLTLFLLMSPCP
jgi:hypothetical protein